MNRTCASALFLGVSLLATAGAQAVPLDVKTGLWQSTLKSELSGPVQGPRTITYKSCLTPKQLEKDPVAEPMQRDQTCSTKMTSQTRTVWQGTRVCTGAEGRQEYSGKLTAVSRERVTGTLLVKMSQRGYTMSNHAKYESKWLSSSCGNVK
ncbi:MAG: DUF3617 domain-containing protein [Sphingomonadaceae bacterium]